jgi:hypothetical protein
MKSLNNILEWLSILVMLTTLVFSLIHRNKKNLFLIQIYIIVSLILNVLLKMLEYMPENKFTSYYSSLLVNIYSIIEITLISLFLLPLVNGRKSKATIKILYLIYISICATIFIAFKDGIFANMSLIFGLENLFIAVPCLLYIFEMIKSDDTIDLKSNSNFIAVCGIFFYFCITIPFFFANYSALRLGLYKFFSLLNTTFYILLFVSFLKAYLCPLQESRN